jgi:hypothetical protein
MTNAEILTAVKTGLGITTDYQNDLLQIYINDVIAFMQDAGVPANVVTSNAAVGCILRGVSDLWNYTAGGVKFSEYFKMRVIQLAGGA